MLTAIEVGAYLRVGAYYCFQHFQRMTFWQNNKTKDDKYISLQPNRKVKQSAESNMNKA